MILFWIAGFMFVMGYLNECDESQGCLSKLATLESLKLFFLWPFALGKHFYNKSANKSDACCPSAKSEVDQVSEVETGSSEQS